MLSEFEPLPKVTPKDLVRRGMRCCCPNCGKSKIYKSRLRIHHRCPSCGMTLERGDGFYLGPLCINYGIVAFTVVAPLLILGMLEYINLSLALALALIAALALPALLYRVCWAVWLTIYYVCLPDELHANRPEDCDDLSFEEESRSIR